MGKTRSLVGGILLSGAALVALGLLWRAASRRRALPCPSWAVPLLENPYFQALAGAELLLDRARVGPGMSVLDVGCGPGRLTIPAALRVGADGEVVALDIQPQMLARLQESLAGAGLTNVEVVLAGAGDGRVGSDRHDRAFLVTVLGEIPEPEAALIEIFDALKPGGVLSITEVLPDPHYQSRRRVTGLAEAAGFEPQETFGTWWAFSINVFKPLTAA